MHPELGHKTVWNKSALPIVVGHIGDNSRSNLIESEQATFQFPALSFNTTPLQIGDLEADPL